MIENDFHAWFGADGQSTVAGANRFGLGRDAQGPRRPRGRAQSWPVRTGGGDDDLKSAGLQATHFDKPGPQGELTGPQPWPDQSRDGFGVLP